MRVVFALALWLWAVPARADLHGLPCERSDLLAEAAASLLLEREVPTPEALSRAGREAGFVGTLLHASLLADDAALSGWLQGLRHGHDLALDCGEAHGAGRRVVVAAPRRGHLALAGERVVGAIAPGLRRPELVWQGADGKPRRTPVTRDALARGVPVPADLTPPGVVQLVAEGDAGPRPVAQIALGAEAPAPPPIVQGDAALDARPEGAAAGALAPGGLLARLDGFRRVLDAPPLRDNALLARSATRHARRVCQRGQVVHRLSDGEGPVERLQKEHIEARAVGEAIGRARDDAAALQAIFDSPSHRYAVIDRRFTDVGIGAADDARGRRCVVVLLAAWPRRVP